MPSSHVEQAMELKAEQITVLGACNPVVCRIAPCLAVVLFQGCSLILFSQDYPFKAKKSHPLDYIRQYPHLRARTTTFASLLRIRNEAAMALHAFYQVTNTEL